MSYWWLLIPAIVLVCYALSFVKRPEEMPPLRIQPPPDRIGQFETEVVGESYYQDALNEIAGGKTIGGHDLIVEARLIFEDDNKHDPMAVQVWIGAEPVGHLSRGQARKFRRDAPPNTRAFICRAKITGGWRDGRSSGYYGVELDM